MTPSTSMTRADRIIADLMDALDLIRREAQKTASSGSCSFIMGVADQVMENCNAQRERNRDGYLVVRK